MPRLKYEATESGLGGEDFLADGFDGRCVADLHKAFFGDAMVLGDLPVATHFADQTVLAALKEMAFEEISFNELAQVLSGCLLASP